MRLIACLSWFDEQSAWLAELVASMARAGVEHVVAVDGAYMLYPDAKGNSGSEQAQIVVATALGAGMGVTVHAPAFPWLGNELEKRSFMFAAAHLVAEPGVDWLWVCDGDEVIETTGGLRDRLEHTDLDVAEITLFENDAQHPLRALFRAHPAGITVDGHIGHYVDGDGCVLWNSEHAAEQVLALACWDVRVRHRPHERALARDANRRDYYALLDEVGRVAA